MDTAPVIDVTLPFYIARLFYLGDNFHGSQNQPGLRTVQGELIKGLTNWDKKEHTTKTVRLSGRTDKGVHSIGQIVMIHSERPFDITAINNQLPEDICLWAYLPIHPSFNPRRDVLFRHYRYILTDSDFLDFNLIAQAIEFLIGTHNFKFLSKPDGNRPTITTILNLTVKKADGFIIFDVFGTSFLWKLVRKMVTLLKLVGEKELEPKTVYKIVELKETLPSGIRPAPPESLFLVESIIPFHLISHKNAIKRMQKILLAKLGFYKRSLTAFSNISDEFCFQMPMW